MIGLIRKKSFIFAPENSEILITQFDSRYEAHYATPLGRKKGSKLSEAEEENMNKKRSNKTAAKYKERQKLAPVSYINIYTYTNVPCLILMLDFSLH